MSSQFYDSNYSENADIEILLEDTFHPNTIMTNIYGNKLECPTFYGSEPIKGSVQISLNNNSSRLNHSGIKIELIGEIDIHANENEEENNNINNNQFNRFLSLTNNLSSQGVLNRDNNIYDFEFKSIEKQYDSYRGKKFSIKYLLLVTIETGLSSIKKEKEICIFNCDKNLKRINELFINDKNKIKVEIGVESLLHVCFELDRKNYHLKDTITGRVSFKKINLELENMSLRIIKIESLFGKEGEIEPLGLYEIMEGSPTSTEDIIYFKMYLKGFNNISQTIKNEMNNNIRVSYYLCLEICDSENRNFFKKIEINLFRLPEEYYNKLRQNILEGKLNNNIYEINDVNKDKKNINNKMNKKQENKNKKSKIKNLFANIKNPLTDNINIENNDNEDDDNQNEKNNNIIINNNNKNNDKINKEEVKQKQKKKKISSLFNSDFD
jgi:vacuolar protein sorting-associated protein 26